MKRKEIANIVDNDGNNPAYYAAFFGNFDALNYIMESGGDPNVAGDKQITAYQMLIENDHKDLFECVWPHARKVKSKFSGVSSELFYSCLNSFLFSLKSLTCIKQLA